jgi:hypothetical protein
VIVQQECACRLFQRASICCWKKDSKSCPDFRVGSSAAVDCRKYGGPPFGNAGQTQSEACKKRDEAAARSKLCGPETGARTVQDMGSCRGTRIVVKCDSPTQFRDLVREQCGPPVESCRGCTYLKACTGAADDACYQKQLTRKSWK